MMYQSFDTRLHQDSNTCQGYRGRKTAALTRMERKYGVHSRKDYLQGGLKVLLCLKQ